MPTLNKYSDKSGYYIRARPSGTNAPITYQIESEGYSVIESYGLSDGEQISWSVIQSLRSLGLVYTDQSGVLGADEFEPDASQLDETKLDDAAARRLAEVIAENLDIDPEELGEILSILDIEPATFDFDQGDSQANIEFPTAKDPSSTPGFPVHDNIDVLDGETLFKSDDWWKAVIIAVGYKSPDVLVYLWRKDGQSWKRKQKYKVSSEDWEEEKQAIERLVSQTNG